jgi:hypothetical protein
MSQAPFIPYGILRLQPRKSPRAQTLKKTETLKKPATSLLRFVKYKIKALNSAPPTKGNTMTRLYYSLDYDTETRATVSGIQAFSSITERDEFAYKTRGYEITESHADKICLKTHECTAHEAHQRGFI